MYCYFRYDIGKNHVNKVEKKRMSFEEQTKLILASFDALDLLYPYQRRLAFFSLHDYFQHHLLEVGVNYCGIPQVSLRPASIKIQWDNVSEVLSEIETIPNEWNKLFGTLHRQRNKIVKGGRVPRLQMLKSTRNQAEGFSKWIIETAGNYLVQSSGFTLMQRFKRLTRWYVKRADSILSDYGKTVPHYVVEDLRWNKEIFFLKIKGLKVFAALAGKSITSVAEITSSNLDGLISLITEIERLDARESVYLEFNICPICGSKIVSSQQTSGGSSTDPAPTKIQYRIGCEKCDYEIMRETVQV